MNNIMQGDAYSIPFCIRSGNTVITPDLVDTLEISIGKITKNYPEHIDYDDCWKFPVSQLETFLLEPSMQPVQIRIKFNTGEVIGTKCGCVAISGSESREVL